MKNSKAPHSEYQWVVLCYLSPKISTKVSDEFAHINPVVVDDPFYLE